MTTIVTRAGKGAPLTNAEVDANFTNLNTELGTMLPAALAASTYQPLLGYTPLNKAGDTVTGLFSVTGNHGSSSSLVVYNTTTADGRAVMEFRNDRNSVQRYLLGVDPDGGGNKAFALRDVTGGSIRLWVTAAGNLNIGPGVANNSAVNINKLGTGATTINGFGTEQVVQSDVSTFRGYNSFLGTQATSFTLGSLIHYRASQGTFGAGSTVTSQNGFVADASLIGAGTNIGFRGAVPSGSNRWNLFMDGTASNFLAGATIFNNAIGFGASGSPSYGAANQVLTSQGSDAAPSWQSLKTVNGNNILGSGNIQIDGAVTSFNTRTGAVTLSSSDVTTALGYTPYDATNPDGYLTSSALSPYLLSATADSTYLPQAGGTLTGNLTFSGSSLRILGDFTSANRLFVQTTSANSNTVFSLLPNGTSINSQFNVWGNSDITNAPVGALTINATAVQIQSAAAGTGTILPFRVLIGSSEVFRASTGQNFLIGTTTDNGVDKLQVNGNVSAAQFNGSAAGLTGLKTVFNQSVLGTGNIALTSSDVTTALGYTPLNSGAINNPTINGVISIDSVNSGIGTPGANTRFKSSTAGGNTNLWVVPNSDGGLTSFNISTSDIGTAYRGLSLYAFGNTTRIQTLKSSSYTWPTLEIHQAGEKYLEFLSDGSIRGGSGAFMGIAPPGGTSAQRPTDAVGWIRYNTDTSKLEAKHGTGAWFDLGAGGGGGGSSGVDVLGTTTNATETALGGVTIDPDTVAVIQVFVVARRTDGGGTEAGAWRLQALVRRDGTANQYDVGSLYEEIIARTEGNLLVDLVSEGGSTVIKVTGVAGSTYNWKANFQMVTV